MILHFAGQHPYTGYVALPYALERKYPHADREWNWQYVFPAANRSIDPRTKVYRRHHVYPDSIQRAVKVAIQAAKIMKHGSCHTLNYLRQFNLRFPSIVKGGFYHKLAAYVYFGRPDLEILPWESIERVPILQAAKV